MNFSNPEDFTDISFQCGEYVSSPSKNHSFLGMQVLTGSTVQNHYLSDGSGKSVPMVTQYSRTTAVFGLHKAVKADLLRKENEELNNEVRGLIDRIKQLESDDFLRFCVKNGLTDYQQANALYKLSLEDKK